MIVKKQQLIDFKITDPNDEAMSRLEFLERKQSLDTQIAEIQQERDGIEETEVDIIKFLDACFSIISNPKQIWDLCQEIEHKIEFQQMLFVQGLEYDGNKLRTPVIEPVIAFFNGNKKKRLSKKLVAGRSTGS